jgi:hypothetical protein
VSYELANSISTTFTHILMELHSGLTVYKHVIRSGSKLAKAFAQLLLNNGVKEAKIALYYAQTLGS